jgi:probable HAF family extracellular repeat protein
MRKRWGGLLVVAAAALMGETCGGSGGKSDGGATTGHGGMGGIGGTGVDAAAAGSTGTGGAGGSAVDAAAGVIGTGGSQTQDAAAPGWTSADLGAGRCVAANDKGQVVGIDDANATFVVAADGTRTMLGTIDPASITIGVGIDDAGAVSGYAEGPTGRTVVRYSAGAWSAISAFAGFGVAIGVSGDGAIAGVMRTSDGSALQGFLYAGGAIVPLPLPADRSSIAHVAAPGGLVAGVLEATSGDSHAFRVVAGALTELGTLGGKGSAALGINANGDVVGQAEAATGEGHAFLVAAGTTALVDLGLPTGSTSSDARGIDAKGRIAGNADFADGSSHAFVFQAGAATVDILPTDAAGAPYKSAHAAAMTAGGRIVGWGVPQSGATPATTRCLLWTFVQR